MLSVLSLAGPELLAEPKVHLPPPPQSWDHKCCHHAFLTWVLGFQAVPSPSPSHGWHCSLNRKSSTCKQMLVSGLIPPPPPPPPYFATCSLHWKAFSFNHGILGSSLALPSPESFFHHSCLEPSEPSNLQNPGRSSNHGNFSFPFKK